MAEIAERLEEEEIRALALYFARVRPPLAALSSPIPAEPIPPPPESPPLPGLRLAIGLKSPVQAFLAGAYRALLRLQREQIDRGVEVLSRWLEPLSTYSAMGRGSARRPA